MHTVVIVGRPNVGKSTLFNRLIGSRQAIVEDVPGVTRDRQYGTCEWNGRTFEVIDTGGFIPEDDDVFLTAIREQIEIAIDESAVILFLVDVTTGITDVDATMANMMRQSAKPVLLVVNKVDNYNRQLEANEFYGLGIPDLFMLSSISGSGTGELLDKVVALLPNEDSGLEETNLPRFAVLGQPNTGKSTLVNALLGTERHIVTDIAGTTRDSIHSVYRQFGKEFILIDTAGLRRKTKVRENIEFYSTLRTVRAIEEADVCILLLDATQDVTAQDLNIFRLAERRSKGVIVVVNKWDLVAKDTSTAKAYEEAIRIKLSPFSDVPVLFVSAKEKQRIHRVVDEALHVYKNLKQRIPTSKLNDWLEQSMQRQQPPAYRGSYIKIKYATQLPSATPVIALFCNHPEHIREPYRNFLLNRLREDFDFTGVPVRLVFRKK